MSLGWNDLRRAVRRRGAAGAQVFPFLMRDERLHPQLALAVQYFESMVGRPRADLDGEVLVQFFADHRLARGVVASLAGYYGYRRQGLADALEPCTVARLAASGIGTPADLRAHLYEDVNGSDGGFAYGDRRVSAIDRLARTVELPRDVVEALLVLDAEDRAPLARLAPPPAPAQVAATFNHLVAHAVLRAAAHVELTPVARAPALARSLARRATLAGCRMAEPGLRGSGPLMLLGEQDAVGSWVRHGRRLVRALGQALVRHPGTLRGGQAVVEARGGPYSCKLDPAFIEAFAGRGVGESEADGEVYWDPRPELLTLRRQGLAAGWSLRQVAAALVYPEGVLFPEFALARGERVVKVVLADVPPVAAVVSRVAEALAASGDVLVVSGPNAAAMLASVSVPTVPLQDDAPLATVLAAASELPGRSAPARSGPLDPLVAAVREAGFLPVERALALAACVDEQDLALRLAAANADDLVLVPGVGLHTRQFLDRLHGAPAATGIA
jgi:hypothetical protein